MSISTSRQELHIRDLRTLGPGDTVEALRHGDVHYRGRVEATAPDHGVVWVRDDSTGCRAMLHGNVYDVFLLRRALAGLARAA